MPSSKRKRKNASESSSPTESVDDDASTNSDDTGSDGSQLDSDNADLNSDTEVGVGWAGSSLAFVERFPKKTTPR